MQCLQQLYRYKVIPSVSVIISDSECSVCEHELVCYLVCLSECQCDCVVMSVLVCM